MKLFCWVLISCAGGWNAFGEITQKFAIEQGSLYAITELGDSLRVTCDRGNGWKYQYSKKDTDIHSGAILLTADEVIVLALRDSFPDGQRLAARETFNPGELKRELVLLSLSRDQGTFLRERSIQLPAKPNVTRNISSISLALVDGQKNIALALVVNRTEWAQASPPHAAPAVAAQPEDEELEDAPPLAEEEHTPSKQPTILDQKFEQVLVIAKSTGEFSTGSYPGFIPNTIMLAKDGSLVAAGWRQSKGSIEGALLRMLPHANAQMRVYFYGAELGPSYFSTVENAKSDEQSFFAVASGDSQRQIFWTIPKDFRDRGKLYRR